MKTYARHLAAALIACLLAAFSALVALGFCVRFVRPGGDWLDLLGAGVYTVLAVGCLRLIPWPPKENR